METISMKEYTLTLVAGLKDYTEARIQGIEKAINVANISMTARLEGMNEFREQLKDQASKFVTREEVDKSIQGLGKDIKALEKIVYIGVGASLAIQFVFKFLKI